MIYLDNAATTAITPEVFEAMLPFLTEEYGNPGSPHSFGAKAAKAVENARGQVAKFVGAKDDRTIIFTSGGSEANSLAIVGSGDYLHKTGKSFLATSLMEHSSVLNAMSFMGTPRGGGFFLYRIRPDSGGVVSPEKISAMSSTVGMVSVMYVNNEVGSVNDVSKIGTLCKKKNILFHTDCVQAAGAYKLDVEKIGCDFMSVSSHKLHGPKGVGALYIKNPDTLTTPTIFGGKHQEFGVRGGTENVAGIVGFGKACEIASRNLEKNVQRTTRYKRSFYELLCNGGLANCMKVNGRSPDSEGRILNLMFDKVDAETLLMLLDSEGVCVSAGSACTAHESEPSHVLLAIGLTPSQARNSVRVSFSETNSQQDIETAARIFVECVQRLRSI